MNLSPREREVLVLSGIDLPRDEICRLLKISRANLSTILSRLAKKHLMNKDDEYEEFEEFR